jgi:hypothetical protein
MAQVPASPVRCQGRQFPQITNELSRQVTDSIVDESHPATGSGVRAGS